MQAPPHCIFTTTQTSAVFCVLVGKGLAVHMHRIREAASPGHLCLMSGGEAQHTLQAPES